MRGTSRGGTLSAERAGDGPPLSTNQTEQTPVSCLTPPTETPGSESMDDTWDRDASSPAVQKQKVFYFHKHACACACVQGLKRRTHSHTHTHTHTHTHAHTHTQVICFNIILPKISSAFIPTSKHFFKRHQGQNRRVVFVNRTCVVLVTWLKLLKHKQEMKKNKKKSVQVNSASVSIRHFEATFNSFTSEQN